MANVRLLRQTLSDYDAAIEQANRKYASEYDAYTKAVEAFNAKGKELPYVKEWQDAQAGTAVLSNGQIITNVPSDGLGKYVTGYEQGKVYRDGSMVEATVPTLLRDPTNFLGGAPVEPVQPTAPKYPNLTERDYAEIKSPPTDQAGIAIANAKGYTGKSALVAENEPASRVTAFQSAFGDPGDPQNLKQRGILARTLGGQLG